MSKRATVHIVDDDEGAVKPIAKLVESIGLRAECYASAEEFLHRYEATGPSCLVVDIQMPEMSGVVLLRRMADADIRLPTIVVSAYADVRLVVQVMRGGALNFLEKPFRMHELLESIQEAIRLDRDDWRQREEEMIAQSRFEQLTQPERKVLEAIAAGKTNKMIAEELGVSVRTVENRRARIMKKLDVESRTELLAALAPGQPSSENL